MANPDLEVRCSKSGTMHNFRLPLRCKWDLRSSGMPRSADWQLVTDIEATYRFHLDPWRWVRQIVPKHQQPTTNQRCTTSQKSKDLRKVRHVVYPPTWSDCQIRFTTVWSGSPTYVGTMCKNSTISIFPVKCTEHHSIIRDIQWQYDDHYKLRNDFLKTTMLMFY